MNAITIAADEPLPKRHRLTVGDFHKLGEAGILGEDARVELIEGELIDMAPIGSSHAGTVRLLIRTLTRCLGDNAIIDAQNPIILGDESEPQPDIAVLRPRDDYYRASHPRAEDILLLIEVSDSTVQYDRSVKVPLYARHGIPEVWLINLQQQCVEIYRKPCRGFSEYQHLDLMREGSLTPKLLPKAAVNIDDLFAS